MDKEIEARFKALEQKVGIQDDINAIKKLQYAYSHYVMRMMNQEIVDCFADHPDVALHWLEGHWFGKEGVRKYFGVGTERPEPAPEFFHQVMPIAGVIDVQPDRERAKARWYTFGTHSLPGKGDTFNKSFVAGVYEIDYIKQDGIWKFLAINWLIPYTIGLRNEDWRWPEVIGQSLAGNKGPLPFPPADIPFDPDDPRFMAGYILPFHYNHPVTGKPTSENAKNKNVIKMKKQRKKA